MRQRAALTRAGWPRPLTADKRYPVPWVSPATNLAAKDSKRQRRVASGWLCQVCGLALVEDEPAYLFANIDAGVETGPQPGERLPDDTGVHAMDHGLLHGRCARLALAHCPELKALKAEGILAICQVPPGSVEPYGPDVLVVSEDYLKHVRRAA